MLTANTIDHTQRFLLENLDIRGAWVHLDRTWQSVQERRRYPNAVGRLLGEMLAVSVLLSANLKQQGRLTFQIQGSGPINLLVVDCDEQLQVRAMARSNPVIAPGTVPELLGHGQLALTLDAVGLQQPYQSLVPLAGDSIAAIFTHYLEQSEQQPTHLRLAASPTQVAGLFLQTLPGAMTRDADGWNRVNILLNTLSSDELLAAGQVKGGMETRLQHLFSEEDIRVYPARPVTHHCPKDWDKIHTMLRSLGREECAEILREHGEIRVHDDLCGHDYVINATNLEAVFNAPRQRMH